jgi:hypothetical protein
VAKTQKNHPLFLTWRQWWSYECSEPLPALRLILIWDNLAGHLSCNIVRWLLQHGILPLYTPLSDSWLNMAESLNDTLILIRFLGLLNNSSPLQASGLSPRQKSRTMNVI